MQDSELEAMDDIRADGQAHNSGMGDRCFQLWGFGQIASPSVSRGSHRAVHSLGALGGYLGQCRWKHSPGEPSEGPVPAAAILHASRPVSWGAGKCSKVATLSCLSPSSWLPRAGTALPSEAPCLPMGLPVSEGASQGKGTFSL